MENNEINYKKGAFWERLVAFVIDSLILLLVLFPINLFLIHANIGIFFILEFVITSVYNAFFVARTGATIGKRLLKLKVVNKNYEQPKLIHVLIRETIGKYISRLIFGLGFLWVLNNIKHQALHDKLASTYVVKTDPDGDLILSNGNPKLFRIGQVVFYVIAIPLTILIALGLFYGLIARPFRIAGIAMEPNFKKGEFIAVGNAFKIQHGDVVVYTLKIGKTRQQFIKRVVGIPNEKIKIQDGNVYLNGNRLDESSYLANGTKTLPGPFMKNGVERTIPKGYYFVLSDNRATGLDSRITGFVSQKTITGKTWFCYWDCKK